MVTNISLAIDVLQNLEELLGVKSTLSLFVTYFLLELFGGLRA